MYLCCKFAYFEAYIYCVHAKSPHNLLQILLEIQIEPLSYVLKFVLLLQFSAWCWVTKPVSPLISVYFSKKMKCLIMLVSYKPLWKSYEYNNQGWHPRPSVACGMATRINNFSSKHYAIDVNVMALSYGPFQLNLTIVHFQDSPLRIACQIPVDREWGFWMPNSKCLWHFFFYHLPRPSVIIVGP